MIREKIVCVFYLTQEESGLIMNVSLKIYITVDWITFINQYFNPKAVLYSLSIKNNADEIGILCFCVYRVTLRYNLWDKCSKKKTNDPQ